MKFISCKSEGGNDVASSLRPGHRGRAATPQFALGALAFLAALAFFCGGGSLRAADGAPLAAEAVLSAMERVADWQLANPGAHSRTDWASAAGDAGFMALAGISGNPKYRDAMRAAGETNQWQLGGPGLYNANNYCIGQTYAELFMLYRERAMIQPLRERFDAILATPPREPPPGPSLQEQQHGSGDNWSWCEALFMGPPAWMRLYAATDDERYMNFAVSNWWRSADYLFDKKNNLFFHDTGYIYKKEANGAGVFGSRANGLAMAGLARVLQYLPMNHPGRPRFETMLKDMAKQILACQQPDGLWRVELLDPAAFPQKESGGSALLTYALAWGVNQGLLDKTPFQPAVEKAWAALNSCVDADGKLTHVQPAGEDGEAPKTFAETSTGIFGTGAYLLAGSEVYRLAVLAADEYQLAVVRVANPSALRRDCETVELNDKNPDQQILQSLEITGPSEMHLVVMDALSPRILDSQHYLSTPGADPGERPDTLVFQVDLAPGETRQYYILPGWAVPARPEPVIKTFAPRSQTLVVTVSGK
jgi:rhamnogalacturonyl hydrolase YesR